MRKLHKILNLHQLTICYGMTETSPVSFMTRTDDPVQKRIDTVGRLLPHVEAKVVDPQDHNRTLALDQRGELAVSGYSVMKEYYNDADKTAEAMIHDAEDPKKVWMLTGDEASMDAEGYVKITGRIKDLIIRGGENIHPLEVENCLLAHEEVAEVSVAGLPDDKYGEVVAAFIIKHKGAKLDSDQVRGWVKAELSGHLGEWFERTGSTVSALTSKLQCPNMYSGSTTIPKLRVGRFKSSSCASWVDDGFAKVLVFLDQRRLLTFLLAYQTWLDRGRREHWWNACGLSTVELRV